MLITLPTEGTWAQVFYSQEVVPCWKAPPLPPHKRGFNIQQASPSKDAGLLALARGCCLWYARFSLNADPSPYANWILASCHSILYLCTWSLPCFQDCAENLTFCLTFLTGVTDFFMYFLTAINEIFPLFLVLNYFFNASNKPHWLTLGFFFY